MELETLSYFLVNLKAFSNLKSRKIAQETVGDSFLLGF